MFVWWGIGGVVAVYLVVLVLATLLFWRWCLIDRRVGLLFGSIVALVILLVLLWIWERPTERHEYGPIVLHQRVPLSDQEALALTVLLSVAWLIPLVLLGSLILDRLSSPDSNLGRMLTGLPEPCSTEKILSCPSGATDPAQCRLQGVSTTCSREKVTVVYTNPP